jgi:hypothetical protein
MRVRGEGGGHMTEGNEEETSTRIIGPCILWTRYKISLLEPNAECLKVEFGLESYNTTACHCRINWFLGETVDVLFLGMRTLS